MRAKFKLMGGLGNQLFIYAAGTYFSHLHNLTVEFDPQFSPGARFGHLHHSQISGLRDLNLFPEPILSRGLGLELARGSNLMADALARAGISSSRFYTARDAGFVEMAPMSKARYIRGYFQTYKYLDALRETTIWRDPELPTSKNVPAFEELRVQLDDPRAVAIHLRRGDYLNLTASFGVLSVDYYKSGIRAISETESPSQVFVFSDDIELAKSQLEGIEDIGAPIRFVQGLSPEHSLIAMSLARNIVLSNSSFSWWAAQIGSTHSTKSVVAPVPWFRGMAEPIDLVPANWQRVDSVWE